MKKLLLIILLFPAIVLADYKVKFMLNDNILDEFNITVRKDEITDCVNFDCRDKSIINILKENYRSFLKKAYSTTYKEIDADTLKIKIKSRYRNIYDYKENSPYIKYVYRDMLINSDKKTISIKMLPYINIGTDDDIGKKVQLSLPHKVLDTNMDKLNNYTYKFYAISNNWVYLKYDKKVNKFNLGLYKDFSETSPLIYIIFTSLIVVILIGGLYIYIKVYKNTKIN